MSHHLWRQFLENDVESFKKQLCAAASKQISSKASTAARGSSIIGSPSGGKVLSTSPAQTRKSLGTPGKGKAAVQNALNRLDFNVRDQQGLTLLHWIASSQEENAWEFAQALLEQSLVDSSLQDIESSWTPLHRALYFGNVTIARALLGRDYADLRARSSTAYGPLFKIKDREGNSPFDLFNASIAPRSLHFEEESDQIKESFDDLEEASVSEKDSTIHTSASRRSSRGDDELFVFGSNKNMNLGVGDEDDRQFPERIVLKRPKHLLQRLRLEHWSYSLSRKNRKSNNEEASESIDMSGQTPSLVEFSTIRILDIQLSKLHTAILTDDPEANLYTCGFGPGGRLGTGDESTRFSFTCVYGGGLQGEKVEHIGLGQDHTLAITENGEVLSWGNNHFGQLGYSVASSKDEDPIQSLPRKIFGTLKRERAIGCAASRIHSVVFTKNNLFTFGKNEGQLGLVDSDARSLEVQSTPRVVAASLFQHAILQVTAIDKATACLLENTDVWVFANYGYTRVRFPLDDFSNYFLRSTYSTARFGDDGPNHVVKLSSGGDTIAAVASEGQVFTLKVSQSIEPAGKASTTNPVKIKNALSDPQKIWSPRKETMSCGDVDVGQDGSIIVCTKSGSVWRRTKRAKAKDAISANATGSKAKDFKFSRVPSLTCVNSVRSNAYGSFAAIRHDWDVMQTQIHKPQKRIWQDMFALFPFKDLSIDQKFGQIEIDVNRTHDIEAIHIRRAVLKDKDFEGTLERKLLGVESENYDISIGSTVTDIRIPCHEFVLVGRSSRMRDGLVSLRDSYLFSIPDVLTVEYDKSGKPVILFQGLDVLTLFNIVLYLYTDNIVDVWHYTKFTPEMTMRYKQVRVELMKAASALNLKELERASRLQIEPQHSLARDFEQAYIAPTFFEHTDIEIELSGTSYYAHRALMVLRCPFFHGMFAGLSGGSWVRSRFDEDEQESGDLLKVDLTHIQPDIFDIVLRHLYADTGPELFDEVCASNVDEFLDTVMDVMAVANELMLDSLSQICQLVLGRFVNVRNVCQLLNAVAPCSVTTFKIAALEYICLNLEIMLENHLLDELDDDVIAELDDVVRDNQNTFFSRTRRGEIADLALLEKYPDLQERLEISQKRKVDSMALRARRLHREEEEKLSRDPRSPKLMPKSPKLSGKVSSHDLLFDMEEDGAKSPPSRPVAEGRRRISQHEQPTTPLGSPLEETPWPDSKGKSPAGTLPSPAYGSLNEAATPSQFFQSQASVDPGKSSIPRTTSSPWGSTSLTSARLDMKQIMAQATEKRHSSISAGLSAQNELGKLGHGSFKLSQKERKKQMQDQQKRVSEETTQRQVSAPRTPERPTPWQTVSSGNKVSLKDVLNQPSQITSIASSKPKPGTTPTAVVATPQNVSSKQTPQRNDLAKPEEAVTLRTKPAKELQQRSVSSSILPSRPQASRSASSTKVTTQARLPSPERRKDSKQAPTAANSTSMATIRSLRHAEEMAEPSLQLSMADILAQQQLEKESIKEATAKRSLQEIQQEQEFMEWWEAEEKATRARLEAEERAAVNASRQGDKQSASRGKSRRRGGGGRKTTKDDAVKGASKPHENNHETTRASRGAPSNQRGRNRREQ